MPISYFLGEPALSSFRKQKLDAQLQAAGESPLRSLRWLYAVEHQGAELGAEENERLGRLLQAAPTPPDAGADGCILTPRLGTVSPWSSKATDIAHGCGLDGIQRIERARLARFAGSVPRGPQLALLYDRMTEQAMGDFGDM